MRRIIDVWMSLVVAPLVLLWLIFLKVRASDRRLATLECGSQEDRARRVLFIKINSSIPLINRGGLKWWAESSDLNGFFSFVYTLHINARRREVYKLKPLHFIEDFDPFFLSLRRIGLKFTYVVVSFAIIFSKLFSLQRKFRFNLVVASSGLAQGMLARMMRIIFGMPYVILVRPLTIDARNPYARRYSWLPRSLRRGLDCFAFAGADLVITRSRNLFAYPQKCGVPIEKLRYEPFGIPLDKFMDTQDMEFRRRLGFEGRRLVLFVGRLSDENRIDDVLASIEKVVCECPEVLYVFVGEGPAQEEIVQWAADHNISETIWLAGYRSHEEVAKFRLIADVNLCLIGGKSLVEAGASARPIVAYDIDWQSEFIEHGITGLLIPYRDIDGVSDAIIKLLKDEDLASRLGARARELAIQRHSLEANIVLLRSFYSEV